MIVDEFVGRERELAAARRFLSSGQPLVTVLGVGGSGKTRFVLQLLSSLDDAAAFVALEHARDVGDVLTAIGREVAACRDLRDLGQVGRALRQESTKVVVLDAFEHLADLGRDVLAPLLTEAVGTCFVVTSRVPLEVGGEQILLLPPLTPQESLTLLVARARATQFDFEPGDDRESLLELAGRLDGNPLAIELAAARLSVLTPRDLLARLSDRFEVLRRRPAGASDRQSSLELVLDWTWHLLTTAERSTLAQCTIFRVDFTVDAAEAVVGPASAVPILEVLQSLVAKGLLRREGSRLRLLDTVRDYSRRHLGSEPHALEARFASYYLDLVAEICSPEGFEWAVNAGLDEELLRDAENVAVVVRLSSASSRQRVDAAVALALLLDTLGPPSRIEAAIDEVEQVLPPDDPGHARLMRARVYLAAKFRTPMHGEAELRRAMAVARAHGERLLQCTLALRYVIKAAGGLDVEETTARLAVLTELVEASGVPLAQLYVLRARAIFALRFGTVRDSLAACQAVLRACEAFGLTRTHTMWLGNHALLLGDAGQIEEGLRASDAAIADATEASDRTRLIPLLTNRTQLELAADRPDAARRVLERVLQLLHSTGTAAYTFRPIMYGAVLLALAAGRPREALEELSTERWPRRRRTAGHALEHQRHRAVALLLLGGDHEALRHFDQAIDTLRATRSLPRRYCGELAFRALARARLGDTAGAEDDMTEAWASARAWGGPRFLIALRLVDHAVRVTLGLTGAEAKAVEALMRFDAREEGQIPYSSARIAAHLLRGALGASPAKGPILRVGPDFAWVQLEDAPVIALSRRPVPRRLLGALIEAAERTPGRAVPTHELLSVVWPGDKALRSSLTNRLWSTLSKLRREGLGATVERVDEGYRLASNIVVAHLDVDGERGDP